MLDGAGAGIMALIDKRFACMSKQLGVEWVMIF